MPTSPSPVFNTLILFAWFFETQFLYVALAMLELTLKTPGWSQSHRDLLGLAYATATTARLYSELLRQPNPPDKEHDSQRSQHMLS